MEKNQKELLFTKAAIIILNLMGRLNYISNSVKKGIKKSGEKLEEVIKKVA